MAVSSTLCAKSWAPLGVAGGGSAGTVGGVRQLFLSPNVLGRPRTPGVASSVEISCRELIKQ